MIVAPSPNYDYGFGDSASAAAGGVAGFFMVFMILFYLLGFAYSVLNYVLYSLSIYKIAKRRGIHHAWLAWVPVGNAWVLGSVSDQYQYVAKGHVRKRRKVLLGLNIGMYAAMIPAIIGGVSTILSLNSDSAVGNTLAGATLALVLLGYLAIGIISIVMAIFLYIALYDLFCSCDPSNAVLYLVLSILLSVVLPFFLFACRKKDLGMPPKRQPVYVPEGQWATPAEPYAPPAQEPFAQAPNEVQ